jgi:hypothetical protein
MTFLQSNCILDLPDFSITFAGPWERKHRISLDGRVVRKLTLVAEHDFLVPCDPNEEEAFVVPIRALEFSRDVIGIARQSHDLVTVHSLFTISLADDSCKITRGRGRISFCNLSDGPVMLRKGQVVAEWRPSTDVYLITTAGGEVLQQPVDTTDIDMVDSAGSSLPLESAPDAVIITTTDVRLLGAIVGGHHLSRTDNEALRHQLLDSGAFDQRKSTSFTPLITCTIEVQPGSSPPALNPYRAPQADRVVIDGWWRSS